MNEMASFKARLRLAALLSATVVIGFAFPGCVTTVSIECANGLICPSGSRCDDTNHRCVTDPEQSPCIDHVDGDACKLFSADGACHAGVCVVLFCGDGIVNGTEDCDGAPPAGQTCLDLGFDRGLLGCSERCKTVTDQCARFGWKALPPATMDVLDGVWANHWDDVYVASRGEKVAVLHWDGSAWSQMAGSQMTWETGSPQIWGSSSNDLFFTVGGGGRIVRFDGVQWTRAWSGPPTSKIWGSGPDDVYAGLWDVPAGMPPLVHWNGTKWGPVDVGGSADFGVWSVWGSGSNDLFVAGGPTIKHWDGSTWFEQAYDAPPYKEASDAVPIGFTALGGSSPTDVFAVGFGSGGGAIVHFDGASWSPITWETNSRSFNGVWSRDANEALIVGDDTSRGLSEGVIEQWNGSTWSRMPIGNAPSLNAIWGADGGVVAVGTAGTVLQWDRVGWSPATGLPLYYGASVWAANANDAYAVGLFGAAHWDGKSWSRLAALASARAVAVWGLSSDDVYAVGDDGIWHGNGEAWTKPANLSTQWRSVWGDATDDVYVVGLSGKIAHWDGKTWSYLTASTEGEDLFSVWGSGPHDIYAAGSQRIFHSNGQTWSAVFSAPSPISWSSVWGSAPNDVYAVGDAGTIVHWDGERWGTMSSGTTERLISVAGSGPGDVFAGSQHRLLHLRAGVWEPVMLPDPVSVGPGDDVGDRWSGGIWVAPTRVFVVGGSSETHLDRGSVTCQGPERICDDGWDNDCDGLQDGADPDCAGKAANERCANLADDDYDGLTDCADPDCATFPRCRQQ